MAKRSSPKRARARKRRTSSSQPPKPPLSGESSRQQPDRLTSKAWSDGKQDTYRAPGSVGERPQAPWHPWPLSEILILVGAIGTLVGFRRQEQGHAVLIAGLAAVVLGTLDFTIREHLSGYRAHTALLASMPTALFHGSAALGLFAAGAPRVTLVLVPVAIDVPLFWFFFRTLRARFQDARRERVFQLSRR